MATENGGDRRGSAERVDGRSDCKTLGKPLGCVCRDLSINHQCYLSLGMHLTRAEVAHYNTRYIIRVIYNATVMTCDTE